MPGSDEYELVVVILDDGQQVSVRRWLASGNVDVDHRPAAHHTWRPVSESMENGSWRIERSSDWARQ